MSVTEKQQEEAMKNKPRIAVTGAGGLVGSYLVQYLVKKGYSVVAIVRTAGKPDYLIDFVEENQANTSIRLADVNDLASLKLAFKDIDVVVHAAGNVNPYGRREEIFRTNVE